MDRGIRQGESGAANLTMLLNAGARQIYPTTVGSLSNSDVAITGFEVEVEVEGLTAEHDRAGSVLTWGIDRLW